MLGVKIYKNSFNADQYSNLANWANANKAVIVDQGEYYECVPVPAPTIEEIKSNLITMVQDHLDAKCQEMGYDNGFACASYIASSVPKFRSEAETFVLWRDIVWNYCYEQLALFEEGKREIPMDIISELPKWGAKND